MFKEAASALKEADNIVVISHLRPDGDTLGSAFALVTALKSIGKTACVLCHSPITPKYQLLTNGKEHLEAEFKPEFVVSVDVADTQLFGKTLHSYIGKVDLVFDHHPTNSGFGKMNVIDPTSSSTGEIILHLIEEMQIEITPTIADFIYIAISTDTGCFRYSNTNANTFRAAAKLAELGADIANINRRFFEIRTRSQIEIERMAMERLRFYRDGSIAVIVVSLDMIKTTEATEDDVEGLSTFPRRILGVEVGITLREISSNEFKISARSNGLVDVAEVCKTFGGGGHKKAAGCTIKGNIDDIEKNIVETICEAFEAVK